MPESQDNWLPLRTLIVTGWSALLGLVIANALLDEIVYVVVEQGGRLHLLPAGGPEQLQRLQAMTSERVWGSSPWIWIGIGLAVGLVLALPLLFNRKWISRELLGLRGLVRYLGCLVLFAGTALLIHMLLEAMARGEALLAGLILGIPFGIWFVLFGELALGGRLGRLAKLGEAGRRNLLVSFGLGYLYGFAATWFLVHYQISGCPDGVFHQVVAWMGHPESPASVAGFSGFFVVTTVILVLGGASSLGLLVALGPSRCGWWIRVATVALAAAPAIVLGWYVSRPGFPDDAFTERWGCGTLECEAKLTSSGGQRVMALPHPGGARVVAIPDRIRVETMAMSETIEASQANLAQLDGYVERTRLVWTGSTPVAWQARWEMRQHLLDLDGSLSALVEDAAQTWSPLAAAVLAGRIPRMPVTPGVRTASEKLLDPARFVANGKGKVLQSRVALHLGRLSEAQRLWDEAVEEGYSPSEDEKRPEAVPRLTGSIRGCVLVRGEKAAGLDAVLFQHPEDSLPPVLGSARAVVKTGEDGCFALGGLPRISYSLGLVLPEAIGEGTPVIGNLGPFALEGGEIDAGLLRIGPE